MRICIVGAGALGTFLAVRLAENGLQPHLIVRGPALEAVRTRGLILEERDGSRRTAKLEASEAARGIADAVVMPLKAFAVRPALPAVAPALGPATALVAIQNGIPWWHPLPAGIQLPELEGDEIARGLHGSAVVGGVATMAVEGADYGIVRHRGNDRLDLAPASGGAMPPAVLRLAAALRLGGTDVHVHDDLRPILWSKLMGSATVNILAAATGFTTDRLLEDSRWRSLLEKAMDEVRQIAAALGVTVKETPAERLALIAGVGSFRPSTLQDREAGRRLEVEALLDAPAELAARCDVTIPALCCLRDMLKARLAQS